MCNPIVGGHPYSPYISCKQYSVGQTATTYMVLQQLLQLLLFSSKHISKKMIYVQLTQPASGRIASTLYVPCALTVRRMFFLIPCAWCLPTPLSPLPCTQRACCGRPPSRHPPHPSPLILLSSDGIRRTHPQFPAPGPPC